MNNYLSNNRVLSCGMEQSCESWSKSTCLLTNFFTGTQVLWILHDQSDSKPTFIGLRMMVLHEFCVFCLFVCFHNSKVGSKKTNIPGHCIILFELYPIWKMLSLLIYNRQRYRMSETNGPLRNGSMNLVRMRWPKKKSALGDGTCGRVAKQT